MYKTENSKIKNHRKRILILPIILCLSSCTIEKNIKLEDGNYTANLAYQNVILNSVHDGYKISIDNYKLCIDDFATGKLKNIRMKDDYLYDAIHYWSMNNSSDETLNKILGVEKALKTTISDDYKPYSGTYYLIEIEEGLYLLEGNNVLRIYELTYVEE